MTSLKQVNKLKKRNEDRRMMASNDGFSIEHMREDGGRKSPTLRSIQVSNKNYRPSSGSRGSIFNASERKGEASEKLDESDARTAKTGKTAKSKGVESMRQRYKKLRIKQSNVETE